MAPSKSSSSLKPQQKAAITKKANEDSRKRKSNGQSIFDSFAKASRTTTGQDVTRSRPPNTLQSVDTSLSATERDTHAYGIESESGSANSTAVATHVASDNTAVAALAASANQSAAPEPESASDYGDLDDAELLADEDESASNYGDFDPIELDAALKASIKDVAPGTVPANDNDDDDEFGDLADADLLQAGIDASLNESASRAQPSGTVDTSGDPAEIKKAVEATILAAADSFESDGSNCELSLRAVLIFMLTKVMALARVCMSDASFLDVFSAEELIDLVLAGMPQELVKYLHKCIESATPWDMFEVMKHLHEPKAAIHKQGCYLISSLLEPQSMLCTYAGQSSRLSDKCLFTRLIEQHLNLEYRLKCIEKNHSALLYNTMNKADQVSANMIFCWPLHFVARHGSMPNRCMETIFITLFRGFDRKSPGYLLNLLPMSLIRAFAERLSIDSMSVHCDIIGAALSHASGMQVYGLNFSVPLTEDVERPAIFRFSEGVQLKLYEFRAGSQKYGGSVGEFGFTWLMTDESFDMMIDQGFSLDQPYVTFTIKLADSETSDNWANIRGDGVTETNPQGFEYANRLVMQVEFVTLDGFQGSVNVQMLSSAGSVGQSNVRNALHRACLAMSVWEYSTGELPRETFGRRRRDLITLQPKGAASDKVWDKGQPEAKDFFATQQFQCQNVACGKQFPDFTAVKRHYGFFGRNDETVDHEEPSGRTCRNAMGFTKGADVDQDAHRIPGVQVERAPPKYQCKACRTTLTTLSELKRHFGFLTNTIQLNNRMRACRKGHDPQGVGEITSSDQLTAENSTLDPDLVLEPKEKSRKKHTHKCNTCGQGCVSLSALINHLFVRQTKAQTKPSKRMLKCRAGHLPGGVLQDPAQLTDANSGM